MDEWPGLDEVFRVQYRDAKGLAATSDPVEAEVYASSLLSMWDQPLIDVEDSVAFFAPLFVTYAGRKRKPDAVALLLGLAAVAPGDLASLARREAMRLRASGVGAPMWADHSASKRFTSAWVAVDPFGDQDVLVAEFERDDLPPLALAALVDHNLADIVKDLSVSLDPAGHRLLWETNDEVSVADITGQQYADRMDLALEAYELFDTSQASEDVPYMLPFVDALLRELPAPRAIAAVTFSPTARRRLLRDFERSEFGRPLGPNAALAADFINYQADYGGGDALRWSPIVVELCLLDWYPRKMSLDAESLAVLPDVLRAWLRFAGTRKNLAAADLVEVVASVEEFEADFRRAMDEEARFGSAKALANAMVAEGISLADEAAVSQWLEGFNSRPQAERDRILGYDEPPLSSKPRAH